MGTARLVLFMLLPPAALLLVDAALLRDTPAHAARSGASWISFHDAAWV
jgi:hypothetical protein